MGSAIIQLWQLCNKLQFVYCFRPLQNYLRASLGSCSADCTNARARERYSVKAMGFRSVGQSASRSKAGAPDPNSTLIELNKTNDFILSCSSFIHHPSTSHMPHMLRGFALFQLLFGQPSLLLHLLLFDFFLYRFVVALSAATELFTLVSHFGQLAILLFDDVLLVCRLLLAAL